MKLDTVIVLVSQRREKYWEQDFFEMPQRWPLDDAECSKD